MVVYEHKINSISPRRPQRGKLTLITLGYHHLRSTTSEETTVVYENTINSITTLRLRLQLAMLI